MLEESVTFEKIQTLRKQKLTLKSGDDLSADPLSSKVSSQVKCANSNNISPATNGEEREIGSHGEDHDHDHGEDHTEK